MKIGVLTIVLAVVVVILLLYKSKLGNKFVQWINNRFLNLCIDAYTDTSKDDYLDYETFYYRVHYLVNGDASSQSFKTEKELISYLKTFRRFYKGKIVRIEKIMKAK